MKFFRILNNVLTGGMYRKAIRVTCSKAVFPRSAWVFRTCQDVMQHRNLKIWGVCGDFSFLSAPLPGSKPHVSFVLPEMPPGKHPSSCDACKHSRIGCNVVSQAGDPCFNCSRRGISCTFRQTPTRASHTKPSAATKRKDASIVSSPRGGRPAPIKQKNGGIQVEPTPSLFGQESFSGTQHSITRAQQALQLHQILWNNFTTLLEPRIGLWIGGSCCPFTTSARVSISVLTRLLLNSLASDHPYIEAHDLSGFQF